MNLKYYFYDLMGFNKEIFIFFNHLIYNPKLDLFLSYFTDTAEFNLYPLYLFTLIAVGYYVNKGQKDKEKMMLWIETISVFIIAFCFKAVIVTIMKNSFGYIRPFCMKEAEINVRELVDIVRHTDNCYKSFPSGHTSFSSIVLFSIWPVLNVYFRVFGVVWLLTIWASRLILGYHFPSDIIYAAIICAVVVFIVRKAVKYFMKKYNFESRLIKLWA